MKKIVYIIPIIAIVLASCVKERNLRYDDGLLGNETTNQALQISYQLPTGFKMVSQAFTDSIAKQELKANPFSEKRVSIYIDTLIGNATISLYDMRSVPFEKTEDRLDFYFSTYNPNGEWESIEKNIFKHGDFDKIVELVMTNKKSDRKLLKYYFYTDEKAQFSIDYYIRDSYYNDFQPFIESSLASFKRDYNIVIDVLE